MLRNLFLGLMMFALTACGMLPGNLATQPTALPTFAPATMATPAPNTAQAVALGGKQSGDLFVWIYSNPNPPVRGNNTFEAVVTDTNGQPIKDAKISFDLDMTNMSHGKNVVQAAPMGEGHFNGKVSFMMPGPWRVLVAVERAGQTSSVRFDFNVNSK
jgi:hypothetical protein